MSDPYNTRAERDGDRPMAAGPGSSDSRAVLSAERRRARHLRRRAALRRRNALVLVLALATLLVAALMWYRAPESTSATEPRPVRSGASPLGAVLRASVPEAQLTPYFASYKGLKLRLPVAAEALTEVGYHQASYDFALPMKSLLPDGDADAAKKKGTQRDLSEQETGPDAVLTGVVLRMWRDRPGKPNTAVDVGASPKTPIVAPLDGTVVLVKRYKLYNKYADYQIHIQPEGRPELDLVMIHVASPSVKAGDRVMAGATPLGVVRKFSDRMTLQLEHYTRDGGDHTHLQLNDTTDPDYEGLKGAIDPAKL